MKKILALAFCLILTFCDAFSQTELATFQEKQHLIKASDSLAKWVDNRVNFALEAPTERLSFLMETNKLAWRAPKTNQENEAWLFLLINQGYYQLQNGDILASINCYEQAYNFSQKHPINLDIEEYILKPLSNNYTRLGDYERGIYIQKRSLALALAQKNIELATSIYCNLATSYRSKGDLKNAEKSNLAGLAIANKSSDIYGLLLSNMADISNEKKDYPTAKIYVVNAINHLKSRRKNSSTAYWLLGAFTLAGDIQLSIGNYNLAKFYYKTAQQSVLGNRRRELTYIINQLGKLSLKQKNYHAALTYYHQALAYLLPDFKPQNPKSLPDKHLLYGENKLQATLVGKAEALNDLGYLKESLQASILAFEVSEQLRKEYTYNVSKEQLQAESKALAELVIEKAYNLWLSTRDSCYANRILMFSEKTKSRILFDELNANQQKNAVIKKNPLVQQQIKIQQLLSYHQKQQQSAPNVSNAKKIADLQFQLSSLQKQLDVKNPSLTISVAELLKHIPEGREAMVFFCGIRNTYLITADNKRVKTVLLLGKTEQIDGLVSGYLNRFFYNGPGEMVNRPQGFYTTSNVIYKALFSQINVRSKNLLIVKDGILNFLPFESLITEDGKAKSISQWPFLIKSATASYAFSLNSIGAKKRKEIENTYRFSGLFLSKTGSHKIEIPAVAAEYVAMKKLVSGNYMKNQDATLANFKDAVSHSDVLHLSSHSYLTDSLKEPVLELYDSKFYLLELADQKKVPHLVVLSACQTADGVYLSGEGVLSFTRGFIAAGSKGIISSLWNVDDNSAAELMVSYYRNLQLSGSTSGVLTKTKSGWLQQSHKNQLVLLPYYWDSLIYTGEEVDLDLKRANNMVIYVLIFLAIFLMIGLLIYKSKKIKHFPIR